MSDGHERTGGQVKRLRIWLARHIAPAGWEFDLTTHNGFYSPCDDDCCIETRNAYRGQTQQEGR